MKITNKIKEAGNLLDIQLLDHIILTPERDLYRSFADEGQL
jgi:DNA repair protein RadC